MRAVVTSPARTEPPPVAKPPGRGEAARSATRRRLVLPAVGRASRLLSTRGWLLRHYHPVSLGSCIDGPRQEEIASRPTHHHWM